MYVYICSADGSTDTESNKLYRKVKHRYRPNLSPRQRPTAKTRHDQAALAASAEARGATHRARPRSPSRVNPSLYIHIYIYIHIYVCTQTSLFSLCLQHVAARLPFLPSATSQTPTVCFMSSYNRNHVDSAKWTNASFPMPLVFIVCRRRWLQDTSKRKLADFWFFLPPPPFLFPRVYPRLTRWLIKTGASE